MKSPESLQEHIRELEERLLRPEVRRSRQILDALLGDEFIEFASDGTAYDKSRVIDALQAESLYQRSISEFRLVAMAEDLVHATYRIAKRGDPSQEPTVSLRSSIWKERGGRWQLIFHQGTICVAP
jgi:hypothetical protein